MKKLLCAVMAAALLLTVSRLCSVADARTSVSLLQQELEESISRWQQTAADKELLEDELEELEDQLREASLTLEESSARIEELQAQILELEAEKQLLEDAAVPAA